MWRWWRQPPLRIVQAPRSSILRVRQGSVRFSVRSHRVHLVAAARLCPGREARSETRRAQAPRPTSLRSPQDLHSPTPRRLDLVFCVGSCACVGSASGSRVSQWRALGCLWWLSPLLPCPRQLDRAVHLRHYKCTASPPVSILESSWRGLMFGSSFTVRTSWVRAKHVLTCRSWRGPQRNPVALVRKQCVASDHALQCKRCTDHAPLSAE